MPTNLRKAQQDAISSGFLDRVGGNNFEIYVASNMLEQYGIEFAKVLAENIKQRGITSSGTLADNIFPSVSSDGMTLTVKVLDYYDFVNEGVRGVKSSKNAPGSPYKYKNYGMSPDGRKSIRQYIQSGKAKVSSTMNDKARGIGLERKGVRAAEKKSLIDRQVDNMIYMIKRFGIKKTNYFTDTVKQVFADFEVQMGEALGYDVKINLESLNKKKY
jgi:hypothetical protein